MDRASAATLGPLLAGTLSLPGAEAAWLIESSGGTEIVEPWFRAKPAFLYPMNVFCGGRGGERGRRSVRGHESEPHADRGDELRPVSPRFTQDPLGSDHVAQECDP